MSEEKRAPLLSDEDMYSIVGVADVGEWSVRPLKSPFDIRDFYEKKITSGELRVAKTATNEHETNHIAIRTFYCSNCHTHTERRFRYAKPGNPRTVKFCPGCGAKIVTSE